MSNEPGNTAGQPAKRATSDIMTTLPPRDFAPRSPTMTLADCTALEFIQPALAGTNTQAVIEELAARLEQAEPRLAQSAFRQVVLKRETELGTWVAPGWALPHARVQWLSKLTFAVGRATKPLIWGATTHPTSLVFLFAVPENDSHSYLSVLSGIARLSQQTELCRQLDTAKDAQAILAVLAKIQL